MLGSKQEGRDQFNGFLRCTYHGSPHLSKGQKSDEDDDQCPAMTRIIVMTICYFFLFLHHFSSFPLSSLFHLFPPLMLPFFILTTCSDVGLMMQCSKGEYKVIIGPNNWDFFFQFSFFFVFFFFISYLWVFNIKALSPKCANYSPLLVNLYSTEGLTSRIPNIQ